MKLSFFKKKQTADEKFREALDKYQKALEQNQGDLRLRIKIAELYLEHNKKEKAIEEYIQAARAYQEKRLLQIAVAIYNHIITLEPDQVDVYTELANLHLKNGFVGDSVAVLEKLAHHYYERQLQYEAVQVLKKIKEIDPNNEFFKIKVEKFYQSKELSEEETLKAGPKDKWNLIAEQHTDRNTQPGGFFDLASALSEDDDVTFSISTVSSEENEHAAARQEAAAPEEIFKKLKTLMETSPDQDSPTFHYNLGMAYERCNEYAEAVHEFSAALQGLDNKLECYVKLADCLTALERFGEAQDMVGTALKLPSLSQHDKLELIYRSGFIYKAQGDTAGALKVFKKIYDADKNFKSVGMEIKKLTSQ